jgi:succinate dehydrogenase / fumarate reductase iron-sulfur subunit
VKVTLRILRFDPEKDTHPHYKQYSLEAAPADRVLDLLEQVKASQDGSLSYRRSCAHGVCGSDAMRINGRNSLACKVLVRDLQKGENIKVVSITIEPLLGLRVIKDLIVDMEPFFTHYRTLLPYLINDSALPEDGRERLQTPEQRQRFDEATRCILCAACTTACPVFWSNPGYLGPAALVTAHRFIFDSRDRGAVERLRILNQRDAVWSCRTVFNCTEACPRDIQVTQLIAELKRAMTTGKLD